MAANAKPQKWRLGDIAAGADELRRACWPKEQHRTEAAANEHVRGLLTRTNGLREPERLASYHCPICHTWHVGHDKYQKREDDMIVRIQKSQNDRARTATDILEERITAAINKTPVSMTRAMAIQQVFDNDPQLYERYRQETLSAATVRQ